MRKPIWILLLATAHCAQVLPVEELAVDLALVEASSINDDQNDTVEVLGQFNRDLFKNESDRVEVEVKTVDGIPLLQFPSRPIGSSLTISLPKEQIDEALLASGMTSTDYIVINILKSGASLKELKLSYSFNKTTEPTINPLTPIEASSECLLETQKDGSNFLIVDYKLQSDSTHDSFVIWAGSDTDLTGKALEDLETYQANAERLLDNTDISGNSSHSLTLTYENDVTESRRVVIWAVRQYASDGVSTIGDPEILTECTVTVGGK